jgi:hypothetical protein
MNSVDHEYFYISYEIVVQDFGIGIPEEKRAKGPLDIVTTWDSEFYPFQEMNFT